MPFLSLLPGEMKGFLIMAILIFEYMEKLEKKNMNFCVPVCIQLQQKWALSTFAAFSLSESRPNPRLSNVERLWLTLIILETILY